MINKVVVAADSYKGTISAKNVCEIINKSIDKMIPQCNVVKVPMADGGEGMIDSYLNFLGGEKKYHQVTSLCGDKVDCEYGLLKDNTAIVEVAKCVGITIPKEKTPLLFNSYGVGELLLHLNEIGIKKIIVGLGGSGTNDLGCGMAHALGYKFLDKNNEELTPYIKNFNKVYKIVKPNNIEFNITVACDVTNTLCGKDGATYTFGPQKGLKQEELEDTDRALRHLGEIIERDLNVKIIDMPGAGAAGGLGAALAGFTDAKLKSGIDLLLETIKFDKLIEDADLVITGEGSIDWQSAFGKVPVGVSKYAKQVNVPCIAICGTVGKGADQTYDYGITSIYSSVNKIQTLEHALDNAKENLEFISDTVIRTVVAVHEKAIRDYENRK